MQLVDFSEVIYAIKQLQVNVEKNTLALNKNTKVLNSFK